MQNEGYSEGISSIFPEFFFSIIAVPSTCLTIDRGNENRNLSVGHAEAHEKKISILVLGGSVPYGNP